MPEEIERIIGRANGYFDLGRYPEALSEVQKALLLDPDGFDAQFLLCRCLIHTDKVTEALEHTKKLVGDYPEDDVAHQYLSIAYRNAKNLFLAETEILHALRIDPEEVTHFGIYSDLLVEKNNWERGLEVANRGLEIDPLNLDCLNNKTKCLVILGRKNELEQSIKNILSESPDYWYSHATVGWAHLLDGNPRQAKIHLRQALELEPTSKPVMELLHEAIKSEILIYQKYFTYVNLLSTKSVSVKLATLGGLALILWTLVYLQEKFEAITEIFCFLFLFLFSIGTAPFGYFLMLRDRLGQMILTREEKTAGWIAGTGILTGFLIVSFAWMVRDLHLALVGGIITLLTIPLGRYFLEIRIRGTLLQKIFTVLLIALGLFSLGMELIEPESITSSFFLIGIVLSSWVYKRN